MDALVAKCELSAASQSLASGSVGEDDSNSLSSASSEDGGRCFRPLLKNVARSLKVTVQVPSEPDSQSNELNETRLP